MLARISAAPGRSHQESGGGGGGSSERVSSDRRLVRNRLEIQNIHHQPPISKLVRNSHHQKSASHSNSTHTRNRHHPSRPPSIRAPSSTTRHPNPTRPSRISPNPAHAQSAIDVLSKLLDARWDPVSKLLDLANLAHDKILKAAGIPAPGQKGAPTRTAGAIWKLCKEKYPTVRSISLADNNLHSLQPMSISSLVATLPDLANLSLSGNKLCSFAELNALSPTTGGSGANNGSKQGLLQLRELILSGNPVRLAAEQAGPTGLQQYLFEACRRFPALEVLDGEAINPTIRSNLPPPRHPTSLPSHPNPHSPPTPQPPLPISIKPAFFSDASTSAFVAAFCCKFFKAFDEDRASLIDVYATKATFSLCASASVPVRAKRAGLTRNRPEMPAQQVPLWTQYINMSRNNARLKGPRLDERLANGPAEIVKRLNAIPPTKHPLSAGEQFKFVLDAWQMPGLVSESTSASGAVIYLVVHGEFAEVGSMVVRSFDRTFVLGAAGPASAAALKGWPCVILTDQLTVRGYSSPSSWTPSPDAAPINAPTTSTLTVEQEGLVSKLMELTKLKPKYSLECLSQNGWRFEDALKNFEEIFRAGGLPLDALVV